MQLEIRDFRKVEKAQINITPIALLAGHNEQGKTSVGQALRILAGGQCKNIFNGFTNAMLPHFIRTGAKEAKMRLSMPDGTTITEAEITEKKGEISPVRSIATPMALGAVKFTAFNEKQAIEYLSEVLKLNITGEVLVAELKDAAEKQGAKIKMESLEKIGKLVDEKGFDGALEKVQESITDARRAWEVATGERFGTSKVKDWKHPSWIDSLETLDIGKTQQEIKALETKLVDVRAEQKLQRIDRGALETKVKGLPAWKKEMNNSKDKEKNLQLDISGWKTTLSNLHDEKKKGGVYECPCCKKPLALTMEKSDSLYLKEVEGDYWRAEQLDDEINRLTRNIKEAEEEIKTLRDKYLKAKKNVDEGEEAQTKLTGLPAGQESVEGGLGGTDEAMKETEAKIEELKRMLVAHEATLKARKAAQQFTVLSFVVTELQPDGMRKRRLEELLDTFNSGKLLETSQALEIQPITIKLNGVVFCGEYPYSLLSSGKQFLVDAALQLAFASIDSSQVILIDGADIIQYPRRRQNLIRLIQEISIPTLITIAMPDMAAVPDLSKAGIGNSYWVDKGVVIPVNQASL